MYTLSEVADMASESDDRMQAINDVSASLVYANTFNTSVWATSITEEMGRTQALTAMQRARQLLNRSNDDE